MSDAKETIVIIGAGPAGLTAAYELATRSNKKIVVLEADGQVGGISKTVDFKGNKIDIGGHRFFSKSDWVLNWWQQFLPILNNGDKITTAYQGRHKSFKTTPLASADEPHMLIRPRKSRIFYQNKLFDYPIKLNLSTFFKMGVWKSTRIFLSLIAARVNPVRQEKNLEDFFINRFGRDLYETFFKDYTQKVWGKPCVEISAEWGRQRIKGLSFKKIVKHYFTTLFYPMRQSFGNKAVEQTLTEYFLYPQKGPGQLWENVADRSTDLGVDLRLHQRVTGLLVRSGSVYQIEVCDEVSQKRYTLDCDCTISTMPVKHLIKALDKEIPRDVWDAASKLEYRDFMIVGLLLDRLNLINKDGQPIDDNWLYIQDKGVKVGRVQLFHNWSPEMTAAPNTCWIGAEYFCQAGDELWNMQDEQLVELATQELENIGLLRSTRVKEGTVVRMPKAYPSYTGSYQNFDLVKEFFNTLPNVYLIGRNGTHKYNNQDHSMLTALEAVNGILSQTSEKENIWSVNTEKVYHEE